MDGGNARRPASTRSLLNGIFSCTEGEYNNNHDNKKKILPNTPEVGWNQVDVYKIFLFLFFYVFFSFYLKKQEKGYDSQAWTVIIKVDAYNHRTSSRK